jgi:fumarate reductase flavoprotein subunit
MTQPVRTIRRAASVEAEVHVAVAVVGGGACGLTAALMLGDAGIDCVVLERDALPSGSTALSSGFIPAPGTRTQREHGVADDSAARFAADIQAKAHGRAAPALVDAYANAIGPALDALQERHGLAWTLLDGFLYPGHSVHRMHALPQKTGAALMAALQAAVEAAGIPVLTQAVVDTLVLDDEDRVVGIDYLRPDGQHETLGCDALLLACNGFGGNPQMVRTLLPEMAEATFGGHVPATTAAPILWGEALGARLRDLGGYQGHGSWVTPQGALMSWAVMMEGGVQLNSEGRRFHDETQGYSEAAVHVLAQPGGIAWNVFDTPLLALARGFPDFCDAEAAGALRRCDSVAALADCIGCEAGALQATLDAMRVAARRPPMAACSHAARRAVLRRQGDRRAVPHPGRPRHRARHARAAARRHAAAQPACRRRRGGRRLGRRGVGLSLRQRAAERRGRRLHRGAHGAAHSIQGGVRMTNRELQDPARAQRHRAGPRRVRRAERTGGRAGRLRGAVPVGRLDCLHAAGPLRRRPDHFHRSGRHARAHHRARGLPVIVDADTGFGNALNTQRTVRGFERAGAAMVQIEDQSFPKRCGHLDGKAVVPGARWSAS